MKKKGRILHIDDDDNCLELFALIYKSWFDVLSVDTFKEFRKKLHAEDIDLVVTDYEMLDVNGLEVLSYVKSNYPDLPVIFYTGQGNEDVAREAFVSGVVDYFTKDFTDFNYKEKMKNSIFNAIERKNLKKELQKSEEIHQLLTEHAGVGIATHKIVLDETGKPVDYIFLSANPAFETQTGLRVADILGRCVTEVLPGIEKTSFIEIFGRVTLTGQSVNFEDYCPTLGRSYFISAYKLDEGRFTTVFSDITERKKAEESVKKGHDRLLAILDSIDEPVYVADPETYEIVFANRVLKEILGEAGNRKCYEYLQNLDAPCPFCTNEKILGEYLGRSYVWEFRNKVNKRWYKCIDKAINWPDGRIVRYEMGVDITERKQVEEQLHLQSLVMDQIKDHVTITDLNGVITYVNKTQEELFGHSRDEIIGQTTVVYGEHEEKGATQREIVQQTLRDGFWRGEVVNYSADGSEMIMDCRTQVVYDENGKPTALCGIATNITERKRTEEAIQKKNVELLDFAYTVSHDLKNPLNLLTDFLTAINNDPSLFEQYFDRVISQKDKMITFIDNLLRLAKSGQLKGDISIFHLEDLFKKIFEINKSNDIPAELIIHSAGTEFEGDIDKFEQLYTNLILNSIKYRDPSKEKIIIEFDCKKDNEGISMLITDNGQGIEKKELGKIFNVGYTSDKKRGDGFGLTIVKKIIDAHSGSIRVISRGIGTGTSFYIHMPQ